MAQLLGWSALIIAGGLGFKSLTSGVEDLADSSVKITGAAVMLGAGYLIAKKAKVI